MNRDERMPVDPEVYERELPTIPYMKSLEYVADFVAKHAPVSRSVLDLMTGTGFLLNEIRSRRSDLNLVGVDLDERYVGFGKAKYQERGIEIKQGNVLTWWTRRRFDVVTCTGAIHHLPYEEQEKFIARIPGMIAPGGFAVLSDCHIDDFNNEAERRLAAAKLGHEYLAWAIRSGADDQVVRATVDILENDVLMKEFKTSVEKRRAAYEKHFSIWASHKTWPEGKPTNSGMGDYVFVLRKK